MNTTPDIFTGLLPVALGGNVFGWTADETESFAILDAFTEAGGTFVDTADGYSAWAEGNNGGESETIIGTWLHRRANRDRILLATKAGANPPLTGLAPRTVRTALDRSLKRLRVDHVDVFFSHRDDPTLPVEEIVTALDALVRAGKARHLGASNITPARLTACLDFAHRENLAAYEVLQPHYNLIHRDPYESESAAVAAAYNLAVTPYAALASGLLTGKYPMDTTPAPGARSTRVSAYLADPRSRPTLEALIKVAETHDAQPSTVALAWLAAQPGVTAAIASASRADQVGPLVAAGCLPLSPGDMRVLTQAWPSSAP
ncbi:aldo/keto reductase [Catenulispora sp. NF23]|uniref:aldo/keto reductase n=1 Tax=Catenulispora pinistramenti TaxID=2705254 RepID=UPI001BA854F1|nr:aldo/keto reductase [Catenulispora pinistramenti]MBS2533113.1 aldo/keto reductase [Catenulispora pinistramenti]